MPLKIYLSIGLLMLIVATIWKDQWLVLISVGLVTCILGVLAATRPLVFKDDKRRRYKHLGTLLIVAGCIMSLIALIDKFLLL